MVALEQMHHSKQVLLRGQAIPVDFFSSPEMGFDHAFDYDSEAGDIEVGLAPLLMKDRKLIFMSLFEGTYVLR